jgi:hypothetical protein
VALLIVAVVGCSGESKPRRDADSVHAVPVAGQDAEAGAASVPTVTARGIGSLQAGMTVAEAAAALGSALTVSAGDDTTGCHYRTWRGAPAGVAVMVEGGRIARVDIERVGLRTAAGVGVGDTEAEVERAYRGRVVVSPHKYEAGHYLTVKDSTDSRFALIFETSAGKVTRYRAGLRPSVEYVEGCS